MNAKLDNFLLNDVEELITAINNSNELQQMKLNETFETLGSFALYWERHLPSLRASKNNIEYRGGINYPSNE